MDRLVIKPSKGVISWAVSHSYNVATDNPALVAVEDAAPLVEWALKMLEPIPDLTNRFLIQCANVGDLTVLCGLKKKKEKAY